MQCIQPSRNQNKSPQSKSNQRLHSRDQTLNSRSFRLIWLHTNGTACSLLNKQQSWCLRAKARPSNGLKSVGPWLRSSGNTWRIFPPRLFSNLRCCWRLAGLVLRAFCFWCTAVIVRQVAAGDADRGRRRSPVGLKTGSALVEHRFPLRPRQFAVHFHFILRLKNFSSNRSLTNLRANRECHRTAPRARKPPAQPIVCPAAVRYSHARLDSCRSDGS